MCLLYPLFLISFLNIRKDIKRDRYFRYFILLSLLSLIALYLFYVKIQVLSPRYTVFFILPAFIFISFGIEKIMLFLAKRGLHEKYALMLICLYIMTSVLASPSTLVPRTTDKIVYKTAGEYIAKIENNRKYDHYGSGHEDNVLCKPDFPCHRMQQPTHEI